MLDLSIFFLSLISFASSSCITNHPVETDASFPYNLNGKLAYHGYVNYGDGTSQIFIFDFTSNNLTQVSTSSWGITDPMNAVFSPDGKWITFMGVQNNAWNVFVWQVGTSNLPISLTNSTGQTRNEDPKFSKDGKFLYFKQNGDVMQANLTYTNGVPSFGNVIDITNTAPNVENSMPFPSPDGSKVYFTTGSGYSLNIYLITLANGTKIAFDTPQGLAAYYPIVRADGTVFYARWKDNVSQADQITTKVNPTDVPNQLSINDCASSNSDAWPVDNTNYTFFSSTINGNYQIFVGDVNSGKIWSLSQFGINSNTSLKYIGSSYYGSTSGQQPSLLSQGQPSNASSSYSSSLTPNYAFDGNLNTRWDSIEGSSAGTQWIYVDLGATHTITGVDLYWDSAALKYQIQLSNNTVNWTTIYTVTNGVSYALTSIPGLKGSGRYVRVYCTQRATQWGYSIDEMKVWGY